MSKSENRKSRLSISKNPVVEINNNINNNEIVETSNEFLSVNKDLNKNEHRKSRLSTARKSIMASNSNFNMIDEEDLDVILFKTIDEKIENFRNEIQPLVISIENKLNNFKTESMDKFINLNSQLSDCQILRKTDKSDRIIELKKINNNINLINDKIKSSNISIDNISKVLCSCVETLKIQNALDIQDENDKNAMALYGQKEKNVEITKNSVDLSLNLNNQCLSCSGQSAFIVSAFKMACICYSPNEI